MADRSPNFPSISLPDAINAIRLIYQREGRSKMPRLSAVRPLGYSSINGRSLAVLGALRAYGLLDGRGDDVRVSDDAITILNAPQDSSERAESLVRCYDSPPAFALLRGQGDASPDTLKWHLIKANFRDDAADKLLKVFLESRDYVASTAGKQQEPTGAAASPAFSPRPVAGDIVRWESQGVVQFEDKRLLGFSDDGEWAFVEGSQTGIPAGEIEMVERAKTPPPAPRAFQRPVEAGEPDFVVKLGDGRTAVIEIKGGAPNTRHLAKLERFIQLQKELLEDDITEEE